MFKTFYQAALISLCLATFGLTVLAAGMRRDLPLVLTVTDGSVCSFVVRLPASGPSVFVFPVHQTYADLALVHLPANLLARVEAQTAPRLYDPCNSEQRVSPIAGPMFNPSGHAEARQGSHSAVTKWLTELGFDSVLKRMSALDSRRLVAVFGWGQSVALPCPTKFDRLPDLVWLSKRDVIDEMVWIVEGRSDYFTIDRMPMFRSTAHVLVPRCVSGESERLHSLVVERVRASAAQSAVLEFASSTQLCDRCPVSPLNDSEWESFFAARRTKFATTAYERKLQRFRLKSSNAGIFRQVETTPTASITDHQSVYELSAAPQCTGNSMALDADKPWREVAKAIGKPTVVAKRLVCNI